MKTLTEFGAAALKNAIAKKKELTDAGKTAEELPAALGEALKVEGDKLTYLLGALEATNEAIRDDFKRVIVASLGEGEKAPSGAKQVGDKYYTVEHYAPAFRKGAPEESRGFGKRGGRDGKGRGGKGGKRGERGGREGGRGGDRPGGGERGGRGGERSAGGRGPRPAQAAGPLPLPKPLSQPVNQPTEAPAQAAKAESETPSSG
jgi:hypothetical protein